MVKLPVSRLSVAFSVVFDLQYPEYVLYVTYSISWFLSFCYFCSLQALWSVIHAVVYNNYINEICCLLLELSTVNNMKYHFNLSTPVKLCLIKSIEIYCEFLNGFWDTLTLASFEICKVSLRCLHFSFMESILLWT